VPEDNRLAYRLTSVFRGCSKRQYSHPPTPARRDAPFTDQGRSYRVTIEPGCSKRLVFSPAPPWRAETRLSCGKAAGGTATEAYYFTYIAGRCATENEVGDRFQHPSILGDLRFGYSLVIHQQIPHGDYTDDHPGLCNTKMAHP